jgi:hypothetical protein
MSQAGPRLGLPFLILIGLLFAGLGFGEEDKGVIAFQEFESSCIDLGHYDEKARQLTVRFVNRNTERFYCYSNIPASIWEKLRTLNETGGVGSYLNDTVVRHPEQYPFKELNIRKFKTIPPKRKAGDSK